MSTQKGNVSRTRGQRYQNATAFKNNKYGTSVQVKTATAKVHDGVCQHCKDVLEWKVKYNKYKPLTQPRKCVKCLQKTVLDAYCTVCQSCASSLQLCAKCGKEKDVVIPLKTKQEEEELTETGKVDEGQKRGQTRRTEDHIKFDDDDDDGDFDSDPGASYSSNDSMNGHSETCVPNISSMKFHATN